MAFSNIISPVVLKKYLDFWISEDIPNFDLSSIAIGSQQVYAHIEMKEGGVLAGVPFAEAIFKYLDCSVEWLLPEGSFVDKRATVAKVSGLSSKLMMAERTALNILSRACGVATVCRRVQMKIDSKWKGEISGTRKTSPGMRMVEKYAMYVGGICTHRFDLSSMIMLKDNHIKINGSIENCVKMIKEKVGSLIMVEVECSSGEDAIKAAQAGANVVMLDNFSAKDVQSVSKQVKEAHPSILIEVSGGINENNILAYAVTNVDIISSSIFCQGYKCIDLSLNIVNEPISLTPEIIETVNDTSTTNDVEIIDVEVIKSTEFDLPEPEVTTVAKAGIKRKVDETTEKTEENKIVTTPVETPKKQNKKIEEKPIRPIVKAKTPVKTDSKTNANKFQRNSNTNKPNNNANNNSNSNNNNNATYNMKHLAPSRMSGFPMQTSTPRGSSNPASIMGLISSGFVAPFQSNQPDDAFFRGATPMKLNSAMLRNSMNNNANNNTMPDHRNMASPFRSMPNNSSARYFCKSCRFQNPMNGPPICRKCRQMLV